MHTLHLQDNSFNRHAKDLGLGEFIEVVLVQCRGIESVAMTRTCATCTTCTLSSGGFGDPADLESLNTTCYIITALYSWSVKLTER